MAGVELALKAIVEPRRRAILRLVRDDELPSGEIARHFDVSGPAISQHLGVLEEAGLVSVRKDGTRRLYRARREGMAGLRQFLEDFWDDGLDRLRDAAERAQRAKDNDDG
jgi:DNA-binding transcriptional ArsR family regulator